MTGVLITLPLNGCDKPDPNAAETMRQIGRIDNLEMRVMELERKLDHAERDINGVRELELENARNHESLRKTFNRNVDVNNLAKVARMTADGACGRETVQYPNGGWTVRNRECTLKDLR